MKFRIYLVVQGLISTGSRIGLIEIESEPSAIDGYAINNPNDPSLDTKIVRAVDGLKFGGLHLDKAYKAGMSLAMVNSNHSASFTSSLF